MRRLIELLKIAWKIAGDVGTAQFLWLAIPGVGISISYFQPNMPLHEVILLVSAIVACTAGFFAVRQAKLLNVHVPVLRTPRLFRPLSKVFINRRWRVRHKGVWIEGPGLSGNWGKLNAVLVNVKNERKRAIKLTKLWIRSDITGEVRPSIPVGVENLEIREHGPLLPNKLVQTRASVAEMEAGYSESEFLQRWGRLTIVVKGEGIDIEYSIGWDEMRARVFGFAPSPEIPIEPNF